MKRFPQFSRLLSAALLFFIGFAAPLKAEFNCPPLKERAEIPAAIHEKGILWRLSRAGAPDSYVFGTIHISDPAVMNFDASVQQAFESTDRFVLEVVLEPESIQAMQYAMFYHEGQTLSAQTGGELFEAIMSLAPAHGLPPELVDYMRPWAIHMTLASPPGGGIPMDMALMLEAQKEGKEIFGLETVEEQVSVLGDLPVREQVALLTQTVCHYDQLQKETQTMVNMYIERDLAGLLNEGMRYELGNPQTDRRINESLIWRRNLTMFERLKPILGSGSTFVAVGALHLPGERGLLELLMRDGYTLERIY